MPSRRRYVVVGVLVLSLLLAMSLSQGLEWIWVRFGWTNPLLGSLKELSLTNMLAALIAFSGGFACLYHTKTRQLSEEVVEELARVTWPSREETAHATGVVIGTVLLSALYLGVFDRFWLWLTNWMLGI
jgi:preprotein translocase SecE subunit